MRRVGVFLAGFVALFICVPAQALSPGVVDPTIELDATKSVLVSSLYAKRGEVIVELYNNTERPLEVSGWKLRFITLSSEADVVLADGWLRGDTFVALSENGLVPGVFAFPSLSLAPLEPIQKVQVLDLQNQLVSEVTSFPADITSRWYQRKSTGLSGTFTSDFSAATSSTKLRHTPLYLPPVAKPLLGIVEIYPHASNCSPMDASILCGDYVKLYNPTDDIAYLADYRLRSDSASSESSNAFHLDGYDAVEPGGYLTISLRDDGDLLSLTDDGGWVWLEDIEGIQRYEETAVNYPSASSSSKVGYAWALGDNGSWQWTSTPMPGAPNAFPAAIPGMGGGVLGELSECPQGKYRNPETNRCRNIEDAIATLAACAEGQFRNPETNRCRSSTAVIAGLSPCAAGQERNPETNRCRNVAAASMLAACPSGQERNPSTNRCRKSVLSAALAPASIPAIQQATQPNSLAMTLLGTVGVGAIGYGIYEWRSEISGSIRKLTARLGKK